MKFFGKLKLAVETVGIFIFVWVIFLTFSASAEPLVTGSWVRSNLESPNVKFMDIRPFEEYRLGHIPRAVSSPYNPIVWRLRFPATSGGAGPERAFSSRVAVLGINNRNHVVIVHAGRLTVDVASATHVYWHFKLMGHEQVSILHGGMRSYRSQLGTKLETTPNFPNVAVYVPKPTGEMLSRAADVARSIKRSELLIDYRTTGHFLGINKIEMVARYGTLPGAKNFPLQWTTVDAGGMIRPISELKKIYEYNNLAVDRPHTAFSDIGQLASLGWFIAHELFGNKNARLYSGGMLEWAADPVRPVIRHVKFD